MTRAGLGRGCCAVAFTLAAAGAAAAPPAADFLNAIGVNTHVYALNTAYGDLPAVLAALHYLGVDHLRDNPPAAARPARYLALAQAGIGLDLVARSDAAPALPLYESLAPHLDVIEGPNEVNAHPTSLLYDGLTGFPAAFLLQANLFDAVKTDAKLRAVPVAMFSAVYHGPADLPPYPGMAAKADLANVHAYPPAAAVPPVVFLGRDISRWAAAAPGAPVLLTEFGYFTLPSAPRGAGVTEAVQAKWLLDTLADGFFYGHVRRQYAYELVDQRADDGAPDKENHFGLFETDWKPKPAAIAIHDLHAILNARRVAAPASAAGVTIAGLPRGARWGVLGGSGGQVFVLIWNEPTIWNPAAEQEIAAPSLPITVTRPGAGGLTLYDPLQGPQPVRRQRGDQISFGLAGDLLVVQATG